MIFFILVFFTIQDIWATPEKFSQEKFHAKITDFDSSQKIFKVFIENPNSKFLKIGDIVSVFFEKTSKDQCRAHIREVERHYLVVFVPDVEFCFSQEQEIRRGANVIVSSPLFIQRTQEAFRSKKILEKTHQSLLQNLQQNQDFLASYADRQQQIRSKYGLERERLAQEEQEELLGLHSRKEEAIKLTKEIPYRLEQVKADILFFTQERIPASAISPYGP